MHMASKRRIVRPVEIRENVEEAPLVTNEALQVYLQRNLQRIEAELQQTREENKRTAAELARLRLQQGSSTHLEDQDLKVGSKVAAKTGKGEYIPTEVTDVFFSDTSGRYLYEVARLDEGKGLGLQSASDLFPPDRARS